MYEKVASLIRSMSTTDVTKYSYMLFLSTNVGLEQAKLNSYCALGLDLAQINITLQTNFC